MNTPFSCTLQEYTIFCLAGQEMSYELCYAGFVTEKEILYHMGIEGWLSVMIGHLRLQIPAERTVPFLPEHNYFQLDL